MMRFLTCGLALLLPALLAAQSGSVRTKCCTGSAAGLSAPCPVTMPPCSNFQCYTGDGTDNRLIDTAGCEPDLVWVKKQSVDDTANGVFRIRSMGTGNSLKTNPGSTAFFVDAIVDFSASGFVISDGPDGETNTLGDTYCSYAFQARDGWLETGSYVGDGTDNRALALTTTPTVFATTGRNNFDLGLRARTAAMPADTTIDLDGAALFDVLSNHIQAFKDVGLGDAYTGVELGSDVNTSGRTYYYFSFIARADAPDDWVFHGSYIGDGVDGDGSQRVINTPCGIRTLFAATAADTGGVPAGTRFLARYQRHHAVAAAAINYAQRWNAIDVSDEAPPGVDGGWREFNAGNLIFGNGLVVATHMANIAGTVYYYWGLCE